jgi:NTP pyrophosphatase (non-canonical NTP hydrolase)
MAISKFQYEEHVHNLWKTKADPMRSLAVMALGIGGEAGEVQELIKKHLRDGKDPCKDDNLLLELGDVLYYVTRLGMEFGYSLDQIMEANLDKLYKRKANDPTWSTGPRVS